MDASHTATTPHPSSRRGDGPGGGGGTVAELPPPAVAAPRSASSSRTSLKARALMGSGWVGGGYIAVQGLRFVSMMVLTYLLAPDVFGVMTMINVFLQGLEMFSDIGIGPSIIHSKRGEKSEFLNTAWTMQVVRGFALWGVACAGAWPVARFYGEPSLLWLIPASGFSSVIAGFTSTSLVVLNRQLHLRAITILDIARQALTLVFTAGWALFISPTVWALIVGSTLGTLFRAIVSHRLMPGHRNRFQWNRDDARSMIRFGRWIFLSTALTFFAMQTDKILLGKMLGSTVLGVYYMATQFAFMPTQFIKRISSQVAFPVLAEVVRERPESVYQQLRRVRWPLIGMGLLPLFPLILFGDILIRFLLRPEFHDAGWMLQILSAGMLIGVVNSSYGNVLLAKGRSFDITLMLAIQLVVVVAATMTGFHLYGQVGFIVAFAGVEWIMYPVTAIVLARHRLWQPEVDLPVFALSIAAIAVAYWAM